MNNCIQTAIHDILSVCTPLQLILFAEKRTMSTGKLKAFSLCVIVPNHTDCRALRTQLHLAISTDVPVNLSVYNAQEWAMLQTDPFSHAAWIARKGQVVYGSKT